MPSSPRRAYFVLAVLVLLLFFHYLEWRGTTSSNRKFCPSLEVGHEEEEEEKEGPLPPTPPDVVEPANNDCGKELSVDELGICAPVLSRMRVRDKDLFLSLVGQLPDVLRSARFSMFTHANRFKPNEEVFTLQSHICKNFKID